MSGCAAEAGVEALYEELDRGLLHGTGPHALIELACSRLAALFGYRWVLLRSRVPQEGDRVVTAGAADDVGGGAALAVPVRVEQRLTAVLELYGAQAEGFAAGELAALAAVARRIGVLQMVCLNQQRIQLQSTALAGAANAVFITDPDGRILWVNRAFCAMSGYREEEVVGRNPRLLKSAAHDASFFRGVWRTIGAGRPWEGEVVERHKDGHTYVVHQTITPIRDDNGRISHFVAIHEDVSDRKRLEQALRDAHDQALESARLKAQFLANMSHEVRTPMNGVLGMLDLLGDTHLAPQQRHYLEVARRSARTLLESLNDILDYSRMEAGELELVPSAVEPYALLDEVLELMAGPAGEKRLELYYRIAPRVPEVIRLDRVRLRQVLANLVGNAVKFTERGEVVVDLDYLDGALLGRVRDTGIGIPEHARERIFAPFSQADGSSARRFGGSGLGLAISRQLVERMGGYIALESTAGVGSTFRFQVAAEALAQPVQRPFRGEALLLVEPRAGLREALLGLARSAGLAAEACADASAALRRLGRGDVRFLLLSEQLDGDARRRLREACRDCRCLPLVAPGARFGAEGLHRPVSRAQLVVQLRGSAAGQADSAPGFHGSVLVVDDDAVNRQVAVSMLARLGVVAEEAADGHDALQRAGREPFDLMLLDCQLPGLDGYHTASLLRERERTAGRPRATILALTANDGEGELERCRAAGMDGLLSKPLELRALHRVLEQRAGAAGGAPPAALAEPADAAAYAILRELDEGDAALVVESFLRDTAERLAALRRVFRGGDAEQARVLAHTLKGSCRAVGATGPARVCERLEAALRGERGEAAAALLDEAQAAFERARPDLLPFLARAAVDD